MNTCGDPRCGRPQEGPGHPRSGWIRLHVAGSPDKDTWWCSRRCIGAGTMTWATRVYVEAPPAETRLEDLNRLAGGERLTLMTATPERVRRQLERAFAKVMAEVEEQARRDRRGRPTTEVLLAEAAGERIDTATCTRCGQEKPVSEFYATTAAKNGLSSWCKPCSAAEPGDVAV